VHYREGFFFFFFFFFLFFFFKLVLMFVGVEERRGFSSFLDTASPLSSVDSSAGFVYEVILNLSVQKRIMV
jgi:hypothetical protein